MSMTVTEATAMRKKMEGDLNTAISRAKEDWLKATGTNLDIRLESSARHTALEGPVTYHYLRLYAMI